MTSGDERVDASAEGAGNNGGSLVDAEAFSIE